MSAHKQEVGESSMARLAANTARTPFNPHSPRFLESQAFGYNPYATVHLRRGDHQPQESSQERRSRLNEMAKSPFKRISRVEQMIHFQKRQQAVEGDEDGPSHNHSLRPHFKVRTSKRPLRHHHPTCSVEDAPALHLQNLSLTCPTRVLPVPSSPPHLDEKTSGNSFQETFKNRRRLNRKSPKKKVEASLLDMLNRISDGIPLQRYKSRAFDNSSKVNAFLHS